MEMVTRVKLKIVAAFILAVLAIVIIVQNVEPVAVQILFVTVTMPRAALLAITLLVGIAIGILISLGLTGRRVVAGQEILELREPQ